MKNWILFASSSVLLLMSTASFANSWGNYRTVERHAPPPMQHRPPSYGQHRPPPPPPQGRPYGGMTYHNNPPSYGQHRPPPPPYGAYPHRYHVVHDWQRYGLQPPPINMVWIFDGGRYQLILR